MHLLLRALLPAAFLVLGVGSATSQTVLISNFTASVGTGTAFGSGASTLTKDFGFTMGGSAYQLDGVTISLLLSTGSAPEVSIWSGPTSPVNLIDTLITPPLTTTGNYTFLPSQTVVLLANQTYWVRVVSLSTTTSFQWQGTSPSTLPSGIATAVGYLFNGASSSFYNRLEIQGSVPCSGSVSIGGVGCADSGGTMHTLSYSGCPDLGTSFTVEMNTSPSATGPLFLVIGISDTNWNAVALPIDLTPFGAPGCSSYVSQEIVLGGLSPTAGQATLSLPIPSAAFLVGAQVFFQSYQFDPGANSLGFATSDYLTTTIG